MPEDTAVDTDLSTTFKPIVVNPSSLPALIGTVSRIVAILVAGFTTLVSLMTAKDMVGVWVWLHTTDGAGFIATIVLVATFGLSMWTTWKKHGKLFDVSIMAKKASPAPDELLVIKNTTVTPH